MYLAVRAAGGPIRIRPRYPLLLGPPFGLNCKATSECRPRSRLVRERGLLQRASRSPVTRWDRNTPRLVMVRAGGSRPRMPGWGCQGSIDQFIDRFVDDGILNHVGPVPIPAGASRGHIGRAVIEHRLVQDEVVSSGPHARPEIRDAGRIVLVASPPFGQDRVQRRGVQVVAGGSADQQV